NQATSVGIGLNYATTNSGTVDFDNFQYANSYIGPTLLNVWQASSTIQPSQVHFNGVHGTLETGLGGLTAANEWYWASSTLYVYSATNPTTAYASPGIEASTRPTTISTYQLNYLTFQN